MKRPESRKELLLISIIVAVILAVASYVCPPYYSMNDDVTMKSIMAGTYTGIPDGHAVYMKYPLTGIISMLYRILNGVSWFDVVMVGCFWLAMSSVIFAIVEKVSGQQSRIVKIGVVLAGSLLSMSLFLPYLLPMHYTIVAAMLAGSAIFVLTMGSGRIWVVLMLLCYCIRSQVFFLALPFLGVVILWRMTEERRKQLFLQVLVMFVGMMICMLWNSMMYLGDDWNQYKKYNDSRTELYDYSFVPVYEENEALYEEKGVSENQYHILNHYALVLENSIDAATMDAVTSMGQEMVKTNDRNYLREYYYQIRYTEEPYKYMVIAGYALLVAALLWKKEFLKILLLGCLAGGRSLIWMYLIRQGRFPERVYVSLYFLEIMLLAGVGIALLISHGMRHDTKESRLCNSIKILALAVLCGICVYIGINRWDEMYGRTMVQKENHEKWEAMVEYCEAHPDTLYFLDVESMVNYSGKVWTVGQMQENYLLAGGWMSDSPLLKERLGDVKDGGELLLEQEEKTCYIIDVNRDVDWLQKYCSDRLEGAQLIQKDSVYLNGEEIFAVMQIVEK